MSVSPTCDYWNSSQQFYKNGSYFNGTDYYNYNNYNGHDTCYNRQNFNNPYVDYSVKNEEEKYHQQYINQQPYVADHFIQKNDTTTTSQLTTNDVVVKSEYLNQFDSCRQAIYNNSNRPSPVNVAAKEIVKPDTTDSPTLRALLTKPKEEKYEYNAKNPNYESSCQMKQKKPIDYQFSSEDSQQSAASNMQDLTENDVNVFYPWMKTSQGKFYFLFI